MTLYRVLLCLFPAAFRRRFGDDMAALFADRLREARGRGGTAPMRLWIRTVVDLWAHGLAERRAAARDRRRRRTMWHTLVPSEDIRYAFRQLRKNPAFTLVAVLTLGLGIGAGAAMFGLIQGVLLSAPPYSRPDRLVLLRPERIDGEPYNQRPTTRQWMAWRASSQSLEAIALYRWTFNFLVMPDGSESLGGMVVSRDYFQVLGVEPMLGRVFVEAEAARPKSPPTAVIIGYELWKRRFNSDPDILGTSIRISRMAAPLPVVGVMPPGVRFLPDPETASEPNYDVHAHVDFWLAAESDDTQPLSRAWNVVGRLRPGATVAQAQAEVAAISAREAAADSNLAGLTASVRPIRQELNREARHLLLPLFGAVALLFFIACANVSGLLLARSLQRQPEYTLRAALGAGRIHLFRQTLVETLTLALAGALVGGVLAAGMVELFKNIGGDAVPRADAVSVGWPVFAFAFLAAAIAAAVAGVLPAARASFATRFQGLQGSRSTAGRAERRLLRAVAILQIVLTVVLLTGAALLVRTGQNLARVRPGYDTENVLAMTVTAVQTDRWKDFHVQALERVSSIPGVQHAAFVWGLPLTGNKWTGEMEIVGEPGSAALAERLNLPLRAVTPAYFDAMGIGLVEGRTFRSTDDTDTPRVAAVNATFARRYFPEGNPIGRRIRFAGDPKRTIEIVGVVSDIRTNELTESAEPEVYMPLWQSRAFSKHLIVRTTSDPLVLAPEVRRTLAAIDPTAAVEHMTTMEEIRRESVAARTFAMHLLAGFSVAATLLALVGLYGVLSLSVGARIKEIAVRKAVGAQRHEIARLVLGEGYRLIVVGVLFGLVVASLLGRSFEALLFGVRPTDPMTLGAAAGLFGAMALLACVLPAWRAVRVDLMEALRHE